MKRFIFVFLVAVSIYAVNWFDNPQRYPNSNYRIPLYKYNSVAFRDSIFMLTEDNLFMYFRNNGFTDTLAIADSLTAVQLRAVLEAEGIMIDSLGVLRSDLYTVISDSREVALDSGRVVLTDAKLYTDARETAITTAYETLISDSSAYLRAEMIDSVGVALGDAKAFTTDAINDSLKQRPVRIGGTTSQVGQQPELRIGSFSIENLAYVPGTGQDSTIITNHKTNFDVDQFTVESDKFTLNRFGKLETDTIKVDSMQTRSIDVTSAAFLGYVTVDNGLNITGVTPLDVTASEGIYIHDGAHIYGENYYISEHSKELSAVDAFDSLYIGQWQNDITDITLDANVRASDDLAVDGTLEIGTNNRFIELIHDDTLAVSVPVWKSLGKFASMLGYFLDNGFSIVPTSATETTISGTTKITISPDTLYTDGSKLKTNHNPTNITLGFGSNGNLTSGENNVFIGQSAGASSTTGSGNIFMGYLAGATHAGAKSNNIYIGTQAGRYSNPSNVASNNYIGYYSGTNNATGQANSFNGTGTGYYATTGSYNTYMGYQAGLGATGQAQGGFNSLFGSQAGYAMQAGASNTFLGYQAGYANTTGASNVYLGFEAGKTAAVDQSNKLIIANSSTNNLIEGDFAKDSLKINGEVNWNSIPFAKFKRTTNFVLPAADTWTRVPIIEVSGGHNTDHFEVETTTLADSTIVFLKGMMCEIDVTLKKYVGVNTNETSEFRIAKGTSTGRIYSVCGQQVETVGQAIGDVKSISLHSDMGFYAGDSLWVEYRSSDVGIELRPFPDFVSPNSATMNIKYLFDISP